VYAIIGDGSHQYRVEEGQVLEVQLHDLPEGTERIEFDRVLFVGGGLEPARIGRPTVEGAKVVAAVIDEIKGRKIDIQKFRRRKGYSVKQGHRQRYLQVCIEKIEV
jgi:large subunit ribosomal protein L21